MGEESIAGGKMKIKGTSFWNSPNVGATNESGFNAYPSGVRYGTVYTYFSFNTIFWSSTSNPTYNANYVNIYSGLASIEFHNMYRNQEVSVRCVKD